MMKVDCITEYGEERYNAGKIELIRNLLSDGEITLESAISQLVSLECEMSVIEEVTGITQDEIENIQKSK